MVDSLHELRSSLHNFAEERDWAQFHTPKNLAMALAGETGELIALLQWLTEDEISERLRNDERLPVRLADELADVLIYLVRLADVTGIDLITVAQEKIARNQIRYPSDLVRGRAVKYTEVEVGGDRLEE
jgi:NTP pyrophosphatase (non-canonical NTP hydrolase)